MKDEGVNSGWGQTADPDVIEVNGKTYLYYSASSTPDTLAGQFTGFSCIKLAIADMPISELVKTNGGVNAGSLGNKSNLGFVFDQRDNSLNFERRDIKNLRAIYPKDVSGVANLAIHGALLLDDNMYAPGGYYIGNNSMIAMLNGGSTALQFGSWSIYFKASAYTNYVPIPGVSEGSILGLINDYGFRWRHDYNHAVAPVDVDSAKIDRLVGSTVADSLLANLLQLGKTGIKIDSSFINQDSVFFRNAVDGKEYWIGIPRPQH
jgi:hypothetical protein